MEEYPKAIAAMAIGVFFLLFRRRWAESTLQWNTKMYGWADTPENVRFLVWAAVLGGLLFILVGVLILV